MEKIIKNDNGSSIENVFPHADEMIEHAKAKAQSLWKGVKSTRRQTWGQTKGFIRKHPAQAVGYAVLLGVVVGALLNSKRRD